MEPSNISKATTVTEQDNYTDDMTRESFVFYKSFYEAISETDNDTKLLIFDAIARYGIFKEEPSFTGLASILWKLIKPQLDANWRRYENGCKGAVYGNMGGAPKGNKNARKTPKQPQNNPKTTPNVNVNDNDNVNVNVNENVNVCIGQNLPDTHTPSKSLSLNISESDCNFVVESWNNICARPNSRFAESFKRVNGLNDERRNAITNALQWCAGCITDGERTIEGAKVFITSVFQKAAQSDFLHGGDGREGSKPFYASFMWVLKPSNMLKIADGSFDNHAGTKEYAKIREHAALFQRLCEGG